MPYTTKLIGGKYRLVKKIIGKVAINAKGHVTDDSVGLKSHMERQKCEIAASEYGLSNK